MNRNILIEGNSLILTLNKTILNDENKTKRINVQKIAPLKDLFNKPITEIEFNIQNINELNKIKKIIKDSGSTEVKIKVLNDNKNFVFKLKNKRFVDRKLVNIIKNEDISAIIR